MARMGRDGRRAPGRAGRGPLGDSGLGALLGEVVLAQLVLGDEAVGDDVLHVLVVDRLRVEQDGNRLSIGLQSTGLVTRATMEYEITMPTLNRLSVDGAGGAHFIGFASTEPFTGTVSGAGRMEGDLSAGDLVLEASGASTISLAGTAGDVRVRMVGASVEPARMRLVVRPPGEPDGRHAVALARAPGGEWVATLREPVSGRRIVALEADSWRFPVTIVDRLPATIALGAPAAIR